MRRNIMGMSNEDVLRRYPDLVSKAHGRQCAETTAWRSPGSSCGGVATLRINDRDLCASHAKSLLNWKYRR